MRIRAHGTELRSPERFRSAAAWLVLAISIGGCFNPFSPKIADVAGVVQPPPASDSPIGIVRLYEWCWNNRDPQVYRELFTEDYLFAFGLTDDAGNAFRDRALNRDEELEIAENIFVRGSDTEAPPLSISLTFEDNMTAQPDSRPGKNRKWHKEIAAQTTLRLEQPDLEVTGITRIFAVRGDSARIPQELIDRGFRSDSTRWYIERIEDETVQPTGVIAGSTTTATQVLTPIRSASWGLVRALYYSPPGSARATAHGDRAP
jgi:hypothetical protein